MQNMDDGLTSIAAWPPPPQTDITVIVQAGKTPITPKAARDFYLSTCMAYGAGFGAAYGAGAGLVYFIVGAIFGAPAGAFLGFILGAVNGAIFGITAARLVRSGTSLSEIERTVRLAAPFATIAGSACLLFTTTSRASM